MISHVNEAVEQFRFGREAAGSAALITVIDKLLKTIGTANSVELTQKLVPILNRLVAAQERGDYLLVADLLQYEVLPHLPPE